MASKLKTEVIGRIGQDAQAKPLDSGWTVINFSVAHGVKSKDADGNPVESTTWIGVAYWIDKGKQDNLSKWLTKGTLVAIEGVPSAEMFEKKDGTTACQLRVKANRLDILHRPQADANTSAPASNQAPAATQPQNASSMLNQPAADDDLPF